jgi:transaldolase/glucose-6-phosphate isomerase
MSEGTASPGVQQLALAEYESTVASRLEAWQRDEARQRLWAKDHTLWAAEPDPEITERLGWLNLHETMPAAVDDIEAFAAEVRDEGFTHVVLLGMGGSSLAPEVFARSFGSAPDHPELIVLDSTHPGTVRSVGQQVDLESTLFLLSSKSGTTIEPLAFFKYFWAQVEAVSPQPGHRFAAITDPGSPLVDLAREHGFRRVFEASPDVGGRYSALTHFGLVPAALTGAEPRRLLGAAAAVAADPDPAFALGAALGELARAGRDKATFLVSPSLAAFPAWIEQLVAESTGKDGTGIVPIADEPVATPDDYGDDRFFVYIALRGDNDPSQAAAVDRLSASGHPVAQILINDLYDIGGEILRLAVAVAMAGSVLGINPFNQPDVARAKELAALAMAGELQTDTITETPAANAAKLLPDLEAACDRPGGYLAIQAFIEPTTAAADRLQRIRHLLGRRLGMATTLGFGPRFLHSTGQLHKGGPDTGLFLQIVDEPDFDLEVPGTGHSFGDLIAGQADGDFQALTDAARKVFRVNLGSDTDGGLAAIEWGL